MMYSSMYPVWEYDGHSDPSDVAVNDIVIVHPEKQPRGFWKLSLVNELVTGRDGKVRGAIL